MLSYAQRIRFREASHGGPAPRSQSDAVPLSDRNPVLGLQRTLGNRELTQLLWTEAGASVEAAVPVRQPSPVAIQAKASSGAGTGSAHEREADEVADRIMHRATGPQMGPESGVAASSVGPSLRAVDTSGFAAPPAVKAVLASSGQPLDSAIRARMESHFGYDFGAVRVHADTRAAQSAKDIGARAYAVGSHIAFGEGQFAPDTQSGQHLIAHELTHVVQQGQLSAASLDRAPVSPADIDRERERMFSTNKGGEGLALSKQVFARGFQIYRAEPAPDNKSCAVWTFLRPEADLFDEKDNLIGKHNKSTAGVYWTSLEDGSTVTGAKTSEVSAPGSGNIPWLELDTDYRSGHRMFDEVMRVRRVETIAGKAPVCDCKADGSMSANSRCPNASGELLYVPYEAVYYFFKNG